MTPLHFRKKPVVIEALQLAGSNGDMHSVYQWIEENTQGSFNPLDDETPPIRRKHRPRHRVPPDRDARRCHAGQARRLGHPRRPGRVLSLPRRHLPRDLRGGGGEVTDSMSMSDEPRQVTITATTTGAQVVIGGADLSKDIVGYDIRQRAGQPPVMVLHAKLGSAAVFEGLAHVVVADESAPGEVIAAFVSAVDPGALERAALDRDDLDGSKHELTVAMLATLADWAKGKVG